MLRHPIGVIALRQPHQEARRTDTHLAGEADQTAGRLPVGARGHDVHRIVEQRDQFLEGIGAGHGSIIAPSLGLGHGQKVRDRRRVRRAELLDFVRPRHRMVLTTFRADGSLQSSPVTGGVDEAGRIVIASYPVRAKSANIRRRGRASITVLSDEFNGALRSGRR